MPGACAGLTIDVPQLPFDVPVNLSSTGSFSGATFNVGQGDAVKIADGTFTGTTTFNVEKQATLDLTGGNVVAYSGTLSGSGLGTVRLANGGVQVGAGGLSLGFPSGMFQWTGGAFDASAGDVTNQGTLDLATAHLTIKGNFKNAGSLTLGPASSLAVEGNFTQTAAGELNEQIGGAPASGQFGQIAVQGQADLAGGIEFEPGQRLLVQRQPRLQGAELRRRAGRFFYDLGPGAELHRTIQSNQHRLGDGDPHAVSKIRHGRV